MLASKGRTKGIAELERQVIPVRDTLMKMKTPMKTVYVLRVRADESEPWGEPEHYRTRKERDDTERLNRVLGGIRTHSYNEKKTVEEVEQPIRLDSAPR